MIYYKNVAETILYELYDKKVEDFEGLNEFLENVSINIASTDSMMQSRQIIGLAIETYFLVKGIDPREHNNV